MKLAVVLLAGSDTADGTGRMANAFITALEAQEAGDEVRIVFDGAGTTWLKALADPQHKYHRLLEKVRGSVVGACLYCARAYGVVEDVERAGIPLLDEYRDHPSIRGMVADGFHVLTF
jgi:sulfur relay (sulfurtransferase) complex TusBCD TusD component (DsrE family)